MGGRSRQRNDYTAEPAVLDLWRRQMDRLFVRTVDDLRDRSAGEDHDWYSYLGIAALLRALLIDSNPLLAVANRPRKLGISFSARPMHQSPMTLPPDPRPRPPDAPAPTILAGACLDPEVGCGQSDPARKLSLDGWLKHQVAVVGGSPVTMHNFVLAVTNTFGAVHRGQPQNNLEAHALIIMFGMETAPGPNPEQLLLRAIGRITAAGLQPLRDVVAASPD